MEQNSQHKRRMLQWCRGYTWCYVPVLESQVFVVPIFSTTYQYYWFACLYQSNIFMLLFLEFGPFCGCCMLGIVGPINKLTLWTL